MKHDIPQAIDDVPAWIANTRCDTTMRVRIPGDLDAAIRRLAESRGEGYAYTVKRLLIEALLAS